MPLFHQRIKPRLSLGPLIVDSLGKKWKKIDQWTAKQNRYEGLGLSTDCPQEASGRLRRPQTEIADFCFAMGLRVAGSLGLRIEGLGLRVGD